MKRLILVLFILGFAAGSLMAQMDGLKGDAMEHKSGLHAGNQFRTTFYNDGTYGELDYPPDIGGEWPINSGHMYLVDGNPFVGSEVVDTKNNRIHIMSENQSANIQASRGDQGPNGEWYTFLPLRGFSSPNYSNVAMSKWPYAWPAAWPDKFDDSMDPGWRNDVLDGDPNQAAWNGYFGKNIFNADEESYFVADDYQNKEFSFVPDSTDATRGGLGIRMYVRGFQWANTLVEDALFVLFDLENIGTTDYDKMVFGYKIGNDLGNILGGSSTDTGDDNGYYDINADVSYMWDGDDKGIGGWGPVGYFGAAFLESPGNHYDGIDNDGDGNAGSGITISEAMFTSRELKAGEDIVLIDYKTFKRTVQKMPDADVVAHYGDRDITYSPGMSIREISHNLIDDNLNGVIDESNGVAIGDSTNRIMTYLYPGLLCVDYINHIGEDNLMIDERRDDGIDNDGDWNPEKDDLGQDGAKAQGASLIDPGEGNGIPTLGEPHFDKTDIDETDMLGLTSFNLYKWEDIPLYEDEKVWENLIPGYFNTLLENENVELFFGSGYFPMQVGQVQRFSMGILCGEDVNDFIENKFWMSKAYNENYNFSKAPRIPEVKCVEGDGFVTLYWDDKAEDPNDPGNIDAATGFDFEGYRIYRSTDPGFNDLKTIPDGKGNSTSNRWPLAQFDVVNDYEGYANAPLKGVAFWLGENLGIQHSYTDTTVINGFTYYYAVTTYDHGSDSLKIAPTECTRFVSLNQDGTVDKGPNVVVAQPEAPTAGYVPASSDEIIVSEDATCDGTISVEVMFPDSIQDGNRYQVTFKDSLKGAGRLLYPTTIDYTLKNMTTGEILMDHRTDFQDGIELPETQGFRLHFHNSVEQLALDTDNILWSSAGHWPLSVRYYSNTKGPLDLQVGDFAIIIGEVGMDTSVAFPELKGAENAAPVNFTVLNMATNRIMPFAFVENDMVDESQKGMFTGFTQGTVSKSKRDQIVILSHENIGSWEVTLTKSTVDTLNAVPGDTAFVPTLKPYRSNDVFEFTMHAPSSDARLAKQSLDDIRVVPNPYVVSNSWEPVHFYSSGRGDRELHFINLPQSCTIRIFNVRGQLVNTLQHESGASNGTVIWNMLSKDNLEISYGVYIYHVDAGKLGIKIGKFAVIK